MSKRTKAQVYGIRPHVFHLWADDFIEAVEMQHSRILAHGLPANYHELDPEHLSIAASRRPRIDFEFYFIALRRLLRVAEAAIPPGYGGKVLRAAIKDFNEAVPGLIEVRDAAEHPVEELMTGETRSWGVGLGGGDAIFSHGSDVFHLNQTTEAARHLYHAIKESVPEGAPEMPGRPFVKANISARSGKQPGPAMAATMPKRRPCVAG
jgi:hypothetical protein